MLLLAPHLALTMMLSNTMYETPPLRLAGIFIVQLIRHRLEVMYPTTLFVRVFILTSLAWLFATTGNPFFLVLVGIVELGFALTLTASVVDRRRA